MQYSFESYSDKYSLICNKIRCFVHECGCMIMDSSPKCETRELSSNSVWVCSIHLYVNTFGKSMNLSLFPPQWINIRADWAIIALIGKENGIHNSLERVGLQQAIMPKTYHCYYDCRTCSFLMTLMDYRTHDCDMNVDKKHQTLKYQLSLLC